MNVMVLGGHVDLGPLRVHYRFDELDEVPVERHRLHIYDRGRRARLNVKEVT